MKRKTIGLYLVLLIGLATINWRGAIGIVVLILLYDWLFELEDDQEHEENQRYYHYLQEWEAEKRRDEKFKQFMEEEW